MHYRAGDQLLGLVECRKLTFDGYTLALRVNAFGCDKTTAIQIANAEAELPHITDEFCIIVAVQKTGSLNPVVELGRPKPWHGMMWSRIASMCGRHHAGYFDGILHRLQAQPLPLRKGVRMQRTIADCRYSRQARTAVGIHFDPVATLCAAIRQRSYGGYDADSDYHHISRQRLPGRQHTTRRVSTPV